MADGECAQEFDASSCGPGVEKSWRREEVVYLSFSLWSFSRPAGPFATHVPGL